MTAKVIIFLTLLAVGIAERPNVGLRLSFVDTQVVGGSEAPKAGYPYIVSLQWKLGDSRKHFCAGSIISDQWVLTAAHCIKAFPPIGLILVKAGKHNIQILENNEQVSLVERSFVHEKYGGGVGPYDIGLIKLKNKFILTKEVQAIGLPEPESDPEGDIFLAGWGSISKNVFPKYPDNLQHVKVSIVDRETCYKSVLGLTGSSPVHETNVCTGPLSGGISACSGDSGGPLIDRSGDKMELCGVVSWGIIPCGTVGAPSVYVRVSKFNSWIQEKMDNY